MILQPSRRGFLLGLGALIAAPAVVRASWIMPVKKWIEPKPTPLLTPPPLHPVGNPTLGFVEIFNPTERPYKIGDLAYVDSWDAENDKAAVEPMWVTEINGRMVRFVPAGPVSLDLTTPTVRVYL